MSEAARLYITVGANTGGAERNLTALNGSLSRTAKSALRTTAAFAGIAGVAAGLKKLTDVTVGFDKNMRNVNSIAHLNEQQFQKLSKSVRELGAKTAQSPRTLADGLYDLVSSGFDANESLLILKSSARAATAGLTDTATSTKAVAAVLNAYHRPASDAAKVSDDLFQTVNRGVLSFEDLAQNIGDVLPFASALHVGLKQVGAATATMTKAGVSAPETMTRIKAVMSQMIKPSTALADTYKKLGVASGEELVKKSGSLQGAIVKLSDSVGGNKQKLAELFPDIRALGGALLLSGDNAKTAKGDLRAFANDAGVTTKTLAEQAKSVSYQWHKFQAQIESIAIGLGSKLIPSATAAIGTVSKFITQMQTGKGAGGDFAAGVVDAFNSIKSTVEKNGPAIRNTIKDITDIAKTLKGAFDGIHLNFGGLLDGLFTGMVSKIHGVFKIVKSALHGDIKGMLSGAGDIISGQMQVMLAPLQALGSGITKPFRSAASAILGLFSSMLSGAAAFVGAMAKIPVIGKPFKGLADDIKGAANAIDGLRSKIENVGGKKGTIRIDANADEAFKVLKGLEGTKIGAKIMHVLGDKKDADGKIKELIALGIPAKKAKVLADVAAALAGINSVQGALAAIPLRKQVLIEIQQHGTASIPSLSPRPQTRGNPSGSAPSSTGGGPKGHGASVGSPMATTSSVKHAAKAVENENPITGEIESHTPAQWAKIRLRYKHSKTLQKKAKARKKAAERKFQGGFDRFDQSMSRDSVAVAAAGLTATPGDDVSALNIVQTLRNKRIASLKKMLKDKRIKGKHRQQVNDSLAGLLGDKGSTAQQIKDLNTPEAGPTGGDFANAGIAVAATTPGLGDDVTAASKAVDVFTQELQAAQATGDPTKIAEAANNLNNASGQFETATQALKDAAEAARDSVFNSDSAAEIMAKVNTPGDTSDDLNALKHSLEDATTYYKQAVAAGDTDGIIKWGNAILGLRDSIDGLKESVDKNTETNAALLEATQQSLDEVRRGFNISQGELRAMRSWIAGIASNQIGQKVGRGLSTPTPLSYASR